MVLENSQLCHHTIWAGLSIAEYDTHVSLSWSPCTNWHATPYSPPPLCTPSLYFSALSLSLSLSVFIYICLLHVPVRSNYLCSPCLCRPVFLSFPTVPASLLYLLSSTRLLTGLPLLLPTTSHWHPSSTSLLCLCSFHSSLLNRLYQLTLSMMWINHHETLIKRNLEAQTTTQTTKYTLHSKRVVDMCPDNNIQGWVRLEGRYQLHMAVISSNYYIHSITQK